MKKLITFIIIGLSLTFNISYADILKVKSLTIKIEIPYILDEDISNVVLDIKSKYKLPEAEVKIEEGNTFEILLIKGTKDKQNPIFDTKDSYTYYNGWGYIDRNVKLFKLERK